MKVRVFVEYSHVQFRVDGLETSGLRDFEELADEVFRRSCSFTDRAPVMDLIFSTFHPWRCVVLLRVLRRDSYWLSDSLLLVGIFSRFIFNICTFLYIFIIISIILSSIIRHYSLPPVRERVYVETPLYWSREEVSSFFFLGTRDTSKGRSCLCLHLWGLILYHRVTNIFFEWQ
jgi:hypothetical protein